MNLHLGFDKEILIRYEKRGAEPLFEIFFESEGEFYPMESWMDFGTVVMGWWAISMKNMAQGATHEELVFMDGPYSLELTYNANTETVSVISKNHSIKWEVPFFELGKEIIRGANEACRELSKINIAEKSCKVLMKGVAELRNALKYNTKS